MLALRDLSFGIGGKHILNSLDFSFEPNQIYGILGQNGAGKTTLFRTIAGLYPTYQGQILYLNQKISREQVSYLETENYFYPLTTGREYLQLVSELKANEEIIASWNNIFELPLDNLIETYSTGMRKKLAFMAILLQNRAVCLFDEPFNGIDMDSMERLFVVIDRLRNQGKTILLSAHVLSTLTTLSDKVLQLENGSIARVLERVEYDNFTIDLRQQIKDKIGEMKFL